MNAETFQDQLHPYLDEFVQAATTESGDWTVKGLIDTYQNIYTISDDTKVISKILELMLMPVFGRFADAHNYRVVVAEHQNHYPDITFVSVDGTKYALDFKSTYRISEKRVSGFTLGAFTGYFRQRNASKNITFPYGSYNAHFVLGVIYSRNESHREQSTVHNLDSLRSIVSVINDLAFLLQEKWRIASDSPGSGNTKNIGSVKDIEALINGQGPFAPHGQSVFDDYWMNYLTGDMARAIDSSIPYRNLDEYWDWRNR